MIFNRAAFIARIDQKSDWDIIIIGGGATGLGTALDAASRGYSTLIWNKLILLKEHLAEVQS